MNSPQNGFSWRNFDAYLFDIDGTLLNSRDAVHYFAFHTAMRQVFGREITIDDVPVHGNTDIGILRAALQQHGIADAGFKSRLPQLLAIMRSEVEKNAGDLKPELCPGVPALLAALKGAGKLMGVTSGNLESIAWNKLRVAGIRDYFAFGSFSDRNEFRKDIFAQGREEARHRLGAGARVCFVGDTPSDVQAARDINAPVIAVATGIYSVAQLQEHTPDACITCVGDLVL
jgi:phosphoglycolate phosphatase-like HAD superfamily hydrolase